MRAEIFVASWYCVLSEVDQIEHLAPVDLLLLADGRNGVVDCVFDELKLFHAVLNQFFLHFQRAEHEVAVKVIDCHLTDVIE